MCGTSGPGADDASSCAVQADLGWALGVVFRGYLRTANAAVADLPGGPRGYQVLSAAARDLPRSQLKLAQQLGVDRTVMTYLLDDLEKAGLVERHPDPADRRARRLCATEAGQELLCRLETRLRQAEEELLAGLRPADRDTLRALLRRVALRLDAADPAPPCEDVTQMRQAAGEPPAAC
jgi:DNA-binding MarR family transcriptional regulator